MHLVKPLGFDISDKAVKRAGLDYWSMVDITVYENIEEFLKKHGEDDLWLTTTKAPKIYTEAKLNDGCYILFGKETAGLPLWLRERYRDRCVRLPMREDARSLNLSNTAAVMCYEALRQQGFPNLKELGEMASNFN
jgi:tRNA (cytidine/uridine-2'-O-)-methyltransferase